MAVHSGPAAHREAEQTGRRIEALLDELGRAAGPRVRDAADELVRLLVDFYGQGLARVVELLRDPGDRPPLARLAEDELVTGLLVLHDLHPEDTLTRVGRALDEVRPYLGSHAGGVEVTGLEGGVLRLRLHGSCEGCPSSTQTVRWTIEGAVARVAPEIDRIEVEGMNTGRRAGAEPLLQIMPKPPGSGGPTAPVGTAAGAAGTAVGAPGEADWHTVTTAPPAGEGRTAPCTVAGLPLLLIRLTGRLYAYRDRCPACGSAVRGGSVEDGALRCPGCGTAYDVRRAGRSTGPDGAHLDPIPLLEDGGTVRVAVPVPVRKAAS